MGVDFIERIRKPLERSWNNSVNALKTPDLLTPVLTACPRSVTLCILSGVTLRNEDTIVLELDGARLRGSLQGRVVGFVDDPPDEVRKYVEETSEIALGRVARLGMFGDHAEISVEECS